MRLQFHTNYLKPNYQIDHRPLTSYFYRLEYISKLGLVFISFFLI